MKIMRLCASLVALLFYTGSTYSQSISVELSVRWIKGVDIFNRDSIIYYPELIITYRNNSDTSYYFSKVSESRFGLPILPIGSLLQYPIEYYTNPNYLERAKSHGSYMNNKYKVEIGGGQLYTKGWIVINDSSEIEVEQEIDMINDDLADIYEYIYREKFNTESDNAEWNKINFFLCNINPYDILNVYNKKFFFLRPGEIYTDTYNLVGFKLIKGCFTFYVSPYFPDYVYTTPIWDKNQSKYLQIKTALPKVVGEYKLYSGNFNTNKITITF